LSEGGTLYRQLKYDLGKESEIVSAGNLKNESHGEGCRKLECAANIIFEQDEIKKLMKYTETQSWKTKPLNRECLYEKN